MKVLLSFAVYTKFQKFWILKQTSMKRLLSKLYLNHFWRNMSEKYNFLIQTYIYVCKCQNLILIFRRYLKYSKARHSWMVTSRLKSFNCKHSLNKYFAECVGFYFTVASLYNGETFVCYSCIQHKLNMEQLFIQRKHLFWQNHVSPSATFYAWIYFESSFERVNLKWKY